MDAQTRRRKRLNELLETAKGKTYFVLFVTFVFTAVMILFGILPSYSAFARQAELNGLRATYIVDLQSKLAQLEGLVVENQSKAAVKGIFNLIMPNDYNQVNYIFELDQIARQFGMNLVDVKFAITNDFGNKINGLGMDPSLREITMNIELEGDKESITNYIRELEKSIRLYNITDISMFKKSEDEMVVPNALPYRYTLLAHTYFFTIETNE